MLDFTLSPTTLVAEKTPTLRSKINDLYLCDEQDYVQALLDNFPDPLEEGFITQVSDHILAMREKNSHSILHQLLQEYDLSTDEGITLMCLAESLIRVPDRATANDLLIDKLSQRGWQHHLNRNESFWVNAASWGLAISGNLLKPSKKHPSEAIKGLVNKLTLAITREAVGHAIRIMGEQFIYAQSIEQAVETAKNLEHKQQCCSFDMLGEEALTEEDAINYLAAYEHAIEIVAQGNQLKEQLRDNISIKLSALHPRYEPSQQSTVLPILIERLFKLAKKAKELDVAITIDAEEQYRLDISLQVFEAVLGHQDLDGWGKFGIVVQAYGKRALSILHWLHALADQHQKSIPLRLVKGAYWDTEIKWAQELGLVEYPVFTQKASTDLNYLACARFLLNDKQHYIQPKFATHNAFTVQYIILNPNVPLPSEILVDYPNSKGIELQHDKFYYQCIDDISHFKDKQYSVSPIINGQIHHVSQPIQLTSPINNEKIGEFHESNDEALKLCIEALSIPSFQFSHLETITTLVDKIGDQLNKNRHELIFLCMKEAGKTLENAIGEVREAIDFCRYYSRQAQKNFADPQILDAITGEENLLKYRPRGRVLCVSPWNFPLAIFVGQVAAALACGNRVVAKPAQQTSIIAQRAIEIMYEAGISHAQLIFLPGNGPLITRTLIQKGLIDMVCFTGSTDAAKQIQQWLIEYNQRFIPMIAETGGQNVMFADSTAHIEQLVNDVITSAFDSSGQRCSALRVLYLQEDIKDTFYKALAGRLACLNVNSPFVRDTDFGPIIDEKAKQTLIKHIKWLDEHATFIARVPNNQAEDSLFLAPCAYEIQDIHQLTQEFFGPILHIIPFKHDELDINIQQVNSLDYGLTLGIHSRNERWINYIVDNAHVGNIYINRSMIGAKVGAQPFGGHGLSGTGPKAGGPNYVLSFVKEFTITTNTAAFGGNQELLS